MHTCAAAESLPEQSGGPVPMLSVAPSATRAEQLSYIHYQRARPNSAFWMINMRSDSCRAFHLQGRKAQPCSTPALHAHPLTAQLFFPFPPLSIALMLSHRPLSCSSSPTTVRPACCWNAHTTLRLSCPPYRAGAVPSSRILPRSVTVQHTNSSCWCVPSPMPGKSGSITVRLRSS